MTKLNRRFEKEIKGGDIMFSDLVLDLIRVEPSLEVLFKAGFNADQVEALAYSLKYEILFGEYSYYINLRLTKPHKILGITKGQFKVFRELPPEVLKYTLDGLELLQDLNSLEELDPIIAAQIAFNHRWDQITNIYYIGELCVRSRDIARANLITGRPYNQIGRYLLGQHKKTQGLVRGEDYYEYLWNKREHNLNTFPDFPNNLVEARSQLVDAVRTAQQENNREGVLNTRAKFKHLEAKYGEYQFILPTTPEEIINEGTRMSNCLGYNGYIREMAEGISVIIFLRKKGEPLADIEVSLSSELHIEQAYGFANSELEGEAKAIVAHWAREKGVYYP